MKKLLTILALLSFVVAAAFSSNATITSVSGSVEIKAPGGAWIPAAVGDVVSSRSMISTGFGSRASLLAGGMELSLKPLTRVTIDSLTEDGQTSRGAVSLQAGRVRATRPQATRSSRGAIDFRLSTPVATAAVRGTDFTVGPYKLITDEGLVVFSQGDAFVFSPGGSYSWAVPGLRPIDPTLLARNKWSVSTTDDTTTSGSKPGRGWAQITLK